MHNFSTTGSQAEPTLSNNMSIIETAYNNEAYHYWVNAAGMEDAGDTASPTYRIGDIATGRPAHWRFANAVNSSVSFYVKRHAEWRDGVLSLLATYSTSAVDGDIRWRVTVTPITNLSLVVPTVVGFTSAALASTGSITTYEMSSADLAVYSQVNPSHIGVLVTVGRQGGGAADTNTGVLYLYGVDLVYKESRRVVGSGG